MFKKLTKSIIALMAVSMLGLTACDDSEPVTFTVTIENVSNGLDVLLPSPIAPGVFAITKKGTPLFKNGKLDFGNGLEALAEDGNPADLGAFLSTNDKILSSGVFNTPVGASGPGPVFGGDSYEFTFTASKGDRLSFATMFVQSNDLFFAPNSRGIKLFKRGRPVSGDITGKIQLWDAGTEENQEPGLGSDQAPRQTGPNTGDDDSDSNVRLVNDEYEYDNVNKTIKVTITNSRAQ